MKDIIQIKIPAKAEYMACLRLAASCIAERAGFDIETIEDIKTAVAEAGLQLLQITEDHQLCISMEPDNGLRVEMTTGSSKALNNTPETEIGNFLLEAMMDSVEFTQEKGISKYILLKNC